MTKPPMTISTTRSDIPVEISNYLILPLLLPPIPPAAIKFTYPTQENKDSTITTEFTKSSKSSKSSVQPHSKTYHYLYLQPHAPRLPHRNASRSLYAVNLPVDATQLGIRTLFAEQLGGMRVERVEFDDDDEDDDQNHNRNEHDEHGDGGDDGGGGSGRQGKEEKKTKKSDDNGVKAAGGDRKRKRGKGGQHSQRRREDIVTVPGRLNLPRTWDRVVHRSGSCAVIVFVDQLSARNALRAVRKIRLAKDGREVEWRPEGMPKLGVERYRKHAELSYPSHSSIQTAVDNHLSAFAAYEAARTAQLVRQRNEPDEDGFVTVTRGAGGRAAPARLEYAQRTAERLKSRQEKMAGGSFYRFQVREKKKERLKALKRGFQEDLKSVEGMRKKGRVRPM